MHKKSRIIVVLAALLTVACGRAAHAAFGDLPTAAKGSLEDAKSSMPVWGAISHSLICAEALDECRVKKALFFGLAKAPKPEIDRISLGAPALPPMAHSVFCVQQPRDCEVKKAAFRGGKLALTPERRRDLAEVNTKVNRSIRPERNMLGLAGEKWLLGPRAGDCNDYAVTKRHELLARGWPSRTLLLAEVVTPWGEHHLILVIRTADGDFVLDNMHAEIQLWSQTPYQWVRVQSPRNPRRWSIVRSFGV